MKNYDGLNSKQVIESRNKYGYNEIKKIKKDNIIIKIWNVIKEPMFLLLICTSLIYFLLGEVTDGITMIVFVVFICGIEFVQEYKNDKAIETLNELSSLNVKVIRNSKEEVIKSRDVVVDDIVLLEEGDSVVADGILLDTSSLGVNESSLTGESQVVYKSLTEEKNNTHLKQNMCYAGTSITNGSAIMKVTNIGVNTFYGQIGNNLNNITIVKTPLENQIKKLVIYCTFFSLFFLVSVILVNYISSKGNIIDSIISGITVAMATIPEEIPVVLTVFLAMGASDLAHHHTLTRNMKTVEILGAITILCTDKTGTLTQNKMVVKEEYVINPLLHQTSVLACQKVSYDPMEIAIKNYCNLENNYDIVHEYIFNNEDKMMGNVVNINDKLVLNVKGAYESVRELCSLSKKENEKIEKQISGYSKKGYRVIAIASSNVDEIKDSLKENKLELCGLLALVDPPREGVKESIKSCYEAGIRVIMITGDNGETAKGIASLIGLKTNDKVITGEQLENMSDEKLKEVVEKVNIFARVYPNHKMRIVSALQSNNEIVAMTGDGVNDAPALKKAEIGIAMGKRGTNVAKEASDMILMDDNFNTIVESVKNGRTIYKNIVKAISYIIVIHIPIAFASLIVPLLGYPLFLHPIHIVLLELVIDPTSSILFQRLKPDEDVMKKRPRLLNESLINKETLVRNIIVGLFLFISSSGMYMYLLHNGCDEIFSRTFAFTILIFGNIFDVYILQSNKLAIQNFIDDFKDSVILIINGVILTILLLIIYIPFLNNIVGTCSLSLIELICAISFALLATIPFDIIKLIKRR